MPPRSKGLVPACLVLLALVAWLLCRPLPDEAGRESASPEQAAARASPPAEELENRRDGRRPQPPLRVSVALDPGFLDAIVSRDGERMTVELPAGGEAEGRVERIESDGDGVVMVRGEVVRPRAGRFFFQRQTAPGKAGPVVGFLHFDEGDEAWRVVPDPADPERLARWEKTDVDHVVCRSYIRPPEDAEIPPTHPTDYPIPPDENGVIQLESLPGAAAVIYLDFDGESRDFTSWGKINAAPAVATNAQIFEVWKGVCEDFLPFDLNITTVRSVYDAAPQGSRIQVVITPTTTAAPGAGGVAYIGSFNWTGDVVCWSFYATGKNAVEVISHEVGHTLGLGHDGRTSPWESYYSGGNGWAPIMGIGYFQTLSQWSKGEYSNASNTQDDTFIIANHNNNTSWREDDHGASLEDASWLEIHEGGAVSDEGVIGGTLDEDSFRFSTSGGTLSLQIRNVDFNPNLNVAADIVAASGAVVATSDPASSADASFTQLALEPGDYLLRVSGAGNGNPQSTGYSDYGSLGAFTVTGSVTNGAHAERWHVAENSAAGTIVGTVLPRHDHGSSPVSFTLASGNTGGTFALHPLTGELTVADPLALDFESLSSRWDEPAEFELFVTAGSDGGAVSESIRVVVSVEDVNEAPTVDPLAPATLLEQLSPGTPVARVTGSDPDRADSLSFSIVSGNTGGAFGIDAATGELFVAGSLDYESAPAHSLVVRATDDGDPALSSETVFEVMLVDIAEELSPGGIRRAFYEGIYGNAVASLLASARYPHKPDAIVALPSFDGGENHGEEYGSAVRGYLVPAVSGDYRFWLASDDWGVLWISTDESAANLVKRAEVVGWTQPRQWDKYASQKSVEIPLVAGRRYRIEALQKEGGGDDHVSVAWQGPGAPEREVVPGRVLVPSETTHAPWMDAVEVTVRESADTGQRVTALAFHEPDDGQTVQRMEIVSGNGAGVFDIHPFTGELVVANGSTLLAGDVHQLTVRATDSGTPAMSGTSMVSVRVVGIEDGLHTWWRFDEASGDVAYDSSGNERHAGIEGGVNRSARDPSDGALDFDGSSGRVEYLGEEGLEGATPFTIAAWVRVPVSHAADAVIIQQREAGGGGHVGQYQVRMTADGKVNFMVYGRDASGAGEAYQFDITSTEVLRDGAWHHVACVRDGNDGLLYIDGRFSAAGNGAVRMLDPSLTVAVGCDARESDDFFAGGIDDVRIYQDALGASQVLRIAGSPRICLTSPVSGRVGVPPGTGLLLDASVSDPDGPEPGGSWVQTSGPATAEMEPAPTGAAAVRFPAAGLYTFRVGASDGVHQVFRDVEVLAGTTATTPLEGFHVGDASGSHSSDGNGVFVFEGTSSGIDSGAEEDSYQMAGQTFSGDFDIRVRIDQVTDTGGTADERAGLMARAGEDASAPGVYIGVNAGGVVQRVVRGSEGGANEKGNVEVLPFPCWVRIGRAGAQVSLHWSSDGVQWNTGGTFAMEGGLRAGLCWSSDNPDVSGIARFSQMSGLCEANIAPRVETDPVEAAGIGETLFLSGTVEDDGMPEAPGEVELRWTTDPDDGACVFSDDDLAVTRVTPSTDGLFTTRLIADDGDARSFADTPLRVLPEVSVSAAVSPAAETGQLAGEFLISRNGGSAEELEVFIHWSGSALIGSDFLADSSTSVRLPAGVSSLNVPITPVSDGWIEGTETVELILTAGDYRIGSAAAIIELLDSNHAPEWNPAVESLPNAVEDKSYVAELTSKAVDPDGDSVVFAKVSGPDWLVVSENGSVSGTPRKGDEGSNEFVFRVSDPLGLSDEWTTTVLVQPGVLNFEGWRQLEFGAEAVDVEIAGDLADPDQDSLANIVEYALGTNPNHPDVSGVTSDMVVVDGSAFVRITIPLDPAAGDVSLVVEGTDSPADPESWSPAGTVIEESTPQRLVVRDAVGGACRFLRLRVSR